MRSLHHREEFAVYAKHAAFFKVLSEPFCGGQVLVAVLLVHCHTRAFQFDTRLEEIARVGPKASSVESNNSRAVGASEASHPIAQFPVRIGIFTLVRVGAGDNHRIDMTLAHGLAQGLKIFYCIFHCLYFYAAASLRGLCFGS